MPRFRPIDNDEEHHRILLEMGVLDDLENWPLYQEQERRRSAEDGADEDVWFRYFVVPGRPRPPG